MIVTSGAQLLDGVREQLVGEDKVKLANRVGLHPSTISRIANGKTRWPRETTLFCVVASLGLQIRLEKK
jgi:DNA-binding transcriptional regulator YdaS (Cro superfamily)